MFNFFQIAQYIKEGSKAERAYRLLDSGLLCSIDTLHHVFTGYGCLTAYRHACISTHGDMCTSDVLAYAKHASYLDSLTHNTLS